MNNPALPLFALLLGVISVISSVVITRITNNSSSNSAWTAQDEAAYSAATEKWRALGHSHGPREVVAEAEANRVTQEFEQQRQKFSNVANRGKVLSAVLWWGGLLISFGGGAGVFFLRMAES